jgi:hypothetical protein
MIKSILFFALIALASCMDDGDFVKHKLQATKGGNCTGNEGEIKMVSNTNGERYQLDKCLPANFVESDCKVSRQGDTILVAFPKAMGKETASYQLVLDVDAKPRYNFIQFGEQLMTVIPTTPY